MSDNLRQNADGSLSIVQMWGSNTNELLRTGVNGAGGIVTTYRNTLARTDTSAKTLFTLPANAIPIKLHYFSAAASNAGTSANISVGKSGGTGTEYLNAQDVKTASTGAGYVTPNSQTNMCSSIGTAPLNITGIYAESGTASSSGGPWNIMLDVMMM